MINEKNAKSFCKDDLSLIENYDLAIADTTQTWICHMSADEYNRLMSTRKGKNNGAYGRHWWNNGIEQKYQAECPGKDFILGQLKKKDINL